MRDQDTGGKRILVRLDLNAPIDPQSGAITDDSRFRAHLPTLRALKGSKVAVLAHQSRAGKRDFLSLRPHAALLQSLLPDRTVHFTDGLVSSTALSAIDGLRNGEILLLENVRFWAEETGLQEAPAEEQARSLLVRTLAPHFDLFVNDAFAAAHRGQVSLTGFPLALPSVAGELMSAEIEALDHALNAPERPRLAILGGAKVDDSIDVTVNLTLRGGVDHVLTIGAVGNFFLQAAGWHLGAPSESFLQREVSGYSERLERAAQLVRLPSERRKIRLPRDVAYEQDGQRHEVLINKLPIERPLLDIGQATIDHYSDLIKGAKVLLLNGPAGVYENPLFEKGTKELFSAVVRSGASVVAGGGHTSAALARYGLTDKVGFVSSGGGATMCFLAGRPMPALQQLRVSAEQFASRLAFPHP